VAIDSVDSLKAALEKCLQPYPDGNPNEVFRSQTFAVLNSLFYDVEGTKVK